MLQRIVWAGANLTSFAQASTALSQLAGLELSGKRVRRITEQIGQDRLQERRDQVNDFQQQPLMQRLESSAESAVPELGTVMMDGGRYQRRDHFGEKNYEGSHWKEDKVGLVLRMSSEVHESDPHPDFPSWLASAEVVAQIASAGSLEGVSPDRSLAENEPDRLADDINGWKRISPQLLTRKVIASSESGEEFGHHLEQAAWQSGVVNAARMAFVADGASVNWRIHRDHFSQMTPILDLMHALSYAWKAAKVLEASSLYEQYARWIWQGEVKKVIQDLREQLSHRVDEKEDAEWEPVQRAITYYENHQSRMNYPHYRQQGLPLTSSLMESTIKQINIRMKGSEKFFAQESGESLLQLRADSLSDSSPLTDFWARWFQNQNGANTYRKQAA